MKAKLEAGTLAWTADYLGMRFYFDSADFHHADMFYGMCVSIPYEAHPDLFVETCRDTPADFIAQLEYDAAYQLPGDAKGRSVRLIRTHEENRSLGLLGTSPADTSQTAGWTFTTQVGTGSGDSFAPTGEASNRPWFYDMSRQDYAPCLVCAGGRYFVYGFGDRDSDDYKTAAYDLNGDAPKLIKELSEGFIAQACYTRWAFPCNPAAVTMADRDCLASYDRITFERDCRIDAETGLPSPEPAEYDAHTVNEAYKMRMAVNGTRIGDDGSAYGELTVPEGAVCVLESGVCHDHYNMRLDDGNLVRLAYDARTRKIEDHYTADIMSVVPAAAADSASIETGPRKRTVRQHGREVPLVPETGNIVGAGAIIDYGDTPWWIAEEFAGSLRIGIRMAMPPPMASSTFARTARSRSCSTATPTRARSTMSVVGACTPRAPCNASAHRRTNRPGSTTRRKASLMNRGPASSSTSTACPTRCPRNTRPSSAS